MDSGLQHDFWIMGQLIFVCQALDSFYLDNNETIYSTNMNVFPLLGYFTESYGFLKGLRFVKIAPKNIKVTIDGSLDDLNQLVYV